MFLVFLNGEVFHKQNNQEQFLGEYEPSFNSNSRSNDYYYDRTGLKGTMFNLVSKKKYEPLKEIKHINNYRKAVRDLELYPETFYTKCFSDFNHDEIEKIPITTNNDPLNTYLRMDQGVLIKSRCGCPVKKTKPHVKSTVRSDMQKER